MRAIQWMLAAAALTISGDSKLCQSARHLGRTCPRQFEEGAGSLSSAERGLPAYTQVMFDPPQVAFRKDWGWTITLARTTPMTYVSKQLCDRTRRAWRRNTWRRSSPKASGALGITIATAPGPHVLRLAVYIVDLSVAAPDVAQDMARPSGRCRDRNLRDRGARLTDVDSCSAGRWMRRRPATMAPTGELIQQQCLRFRERCSKPGRKSAQKASMSFAPCHPSIRPGCKGSNRSFTVRVSAAGNRSPPSRTVPAAGSV